MKFALAAAAVASLIAAFLPWNSTPEITVILLPEFNGELTPCGCTQPMSGGILRLGSAVADLSKQSPTVVLSSGSWVSGIGRQDELKAEVTAESLKAMHVDAVNLSLSEAKLGVGEIAAVQRLLGGDRLLSSCIEPGATVSLPKFVEKKPFLIGGVTADPKELGEVLGTQSVSLPNSISSLLDAASQHGLVPVLLFSGPKADAIMLAKGHPALGLITYSSDSEPETTPTIVGSTWVVSAGSHGKKLVKLGFGCGKFTTLSVIDLAPKIGDSPNIKRLYDSYLNRVKAEKLIDKIPRSEAAGYAGTSSCGKCHQTALRSWTRSHHAEALKTLEKDNHDRDPDCVACHTVGLEYRDGFSSKGLTPDLANVGCESCHGPGIAHSRDPKSKLLPIDEKACMKCHSLNHDPNFDFRTAWAKIKH